MKERSVEKIGASISISNSDLLNKKKRELKVKRDKERSKETPEETGIYPGFSYMISNSIN